MPVFFIEPDQVHHGRVTITGPLLHHLRASLKTRIGEALWFSDGRGQRYATRVSQIDRQRLVGEIIEQQERPPSEGPALGLGQAVTKGEKMDWIVQKATELGVSSITPLISAHTIARTQAARDAKRRERWQRIAVEAAQQAERWDIPTVTTRRSPSEFWAAAEPGTLKLMLCERHAGTSLASVELPRGGRASVLVAVGPEGGWAPKEIEQAEDHGCVAVTLGTAILRSETAALAALTILQSRLGNLG